MKVNSFSTFNHLPCFLQLAVLCIDLHGLNFVSIVAIETVVPQLDC